MRTFRRIGSLIFVSYDNSDLPSRYSSARSFVVRSTDSFIVDAMYSQPARVYRVVSRSGKIYAPDKLIVEISSVRYRPMARVNGPTTLSRSEVIVNKSAPPTPEHSSAGHLLHGPSDTTVTAVR